MLEYEDRNQLVSLDSTTVLRIVSSETDRDFHVGNFDLFEIMRTVIYFVLFGFPSSESF